MIWFAWRQFRSSALAVAAGLLVLLAALALTWTRVTGLARDSGLTGCRGDACGRAADVLTSTISGRAEGALYLAGIARPGPTARDNLAVHALARVLLHGRIDNVQTSWVKLGVEGTRAMLRAGCNDLGGTLMEETISRMAGSQHGSTKSVEELRAIAEGIGRPAQPPGLRSGQPAVHPPQPVRVGRAASDHPGPSGTPALTRRHRKQPTRRPVHSGGEAGGDRLR